MIGTNRNEGEIFVHSAFPAAMPKVSNSLLSLQRYFLINEIRIMMKPVYWMFVGALFRDSSAKILKHYRYLVDRVEENANVIAQRQLAEEENRLNFIEMVNKYELVKSLQIKGVTNISVPIFDYTNYAIAALTIPFVDRIITKGELNLIEVKKLLIKSGKLLSSEMGYKDLK